MATDKIKVKSTIPVDKELDFFAFLYKAAIAVPKLKIQL